MIVQIATFELVNFAQRKALSSTSESGRSLNADQAETHRTDLHGPLLIRSRVLSDTPKHYSFRSGQRPMLGDLPECLDGCGR
jgi:hypothetical protein